MQPLHRNRHACVMGARAVFALVMVGVIAPWGCAFSPQRPPEPDADPPSLSQADGGPALQARPGSFSAYCNQFARLWCQGHMSCCSDPKERHADVAECEQGLEKECQLYFSDPVFGGCVVYDKEAAHQHLKQLAMLTPSCGVEKLSGWYRLFAGTAPHGGDCSYTFDNTQRAGCCQPGTRCMIQSIDGAQVKAQCQGGLKQLGQACQAGKCADGLYCTTATEGTEDHCVARKTVGAPCEWSYECSSSICKDGSCKAYDSQMYYCGKAHACVAKGAHYYGGGCGRSWRCDAQQNLTVECREEGTGWRCTCERNHVQEKTFVSSSICKLPLRDFYDTVGTGCGWDQITW